MAHNPSRRLATLEQVINGNNPFALIPTPLGEMERWRAEAMLIGTTGGIQSVYDIVRADAASQAARADAEHAREALTEHLCNQVTELSRRFDNLEERLAAAEEQRRADQEREAEFNEEPLELPPDIAAHQELSPPTKIGDGAHDTHVPGGELHSVAPKEPPETTANDEELPEPPLETEDDAIGGPPKSVPLSYVHAQDQTEFAIPEPQMTTDARRKPRGSVVAQPISVSLNEQ
jgi:hypothetical protein